MAKIYWAIHGYPPQQNAGAEWMAKEINHYLQDKGHVIQVHNPKVQDLENGILDFAPDVVITHLDFSEKATAIAQEFNIPCINVIHHTFAIPHLRNPYIKKIHVVYNANWVAAECGYPYAGSVVHPPINPERFKDITGSADGYITLVNCNKDKGALIFQEIARAMPHEKFYAVKGNHGLQLPLRARNLKQVDPVDDIREVLLNTRLLLVPSIYESYGRIALEAMACGIPVIATATNGLKEALAGADAAFIHNRNYIGSWIQNINLLSKKPWTQERIAFRKKVVAYKWEQSLKELCALNDLIKSLI